MRRGPRRADAFEPYHQHHDDERDGDSRGGMAHERFAEEQQRDDHDDCREPADEKRNAERLKQRAAAGVGHRRDDYA